MMRTRGLTIAATCLCLAVGAAACIDLAELMPPSDSKVDSGPTGGTGGDAGPGGTGGDSGRCMPSAETCNGLDDDCDGVDDDDDPDTQMFCEGVVVGAETYCGKVGNMWLCVPGDCLSGFFGCDGEPSNGCEPYCMCHDCPDSGNDDGGADDAGEL